MKVNSMLTNKVQDIVFENGLPFFNGKECKIEICNRNGDSLGYSGNNIVAHYLNDTLAFDPVLPENTNIDLGNLPVPQKANFVKVYLVDEEPILLFTQVLHSPFYVNSSGHFNIDCIIFGNPNEHNHTKSQITDFTHTHTIADITNLQTTLDGNQNNLTASTGITINDNTISINTLQI
jgi:hypothetical protein